MAETKIQVAVVDDDESFLRALGRRLRANGFETLGYRSAEAFLGDPTRDRFDCVVLDVHLGGMSGFDLGRRLVAEATATPIIFVTAHDEPEMCEAARQIGCSAYFRKPVAGKALVEAITRAVHLASQPIPELIHEPKQE